MDVEFGVPNKKNPISCKVGSNLENTHYKSIQKILCGNSDKIEASKERCETYDISKILNTPNIFHPGATHPQNILGEPDTILCLINQWLEIPLDRIAQFLKENQAIICMMCLAEIIFMVSPIIHKLRSYADKLTTFILCLVKQVLKKIL